MAADTKLGALDAFEDEVDEKVAVVQAPTVKNTIPKPNKKFSLDDFASDEGNSVPNVGTLHMGLADPQAVGSQRLCKVAPV